MPSRTPGLATPASARTLSVLVLVLLSLSKAAHADSNPCDKFSGGKQQCCKTLLADLFVQAFSNLGQSHLALSASSATCNSCGNDGFCPTGSSDFSPLTTRFFWTCAAGGVTKTADDGTTITICKQELSGGGIAVIVVLVVVPTAIFVAVVLAARRSRMAAMAVGGPVPQVGIQMYAPSGPMADYPQHAQGVRGENVQQYGQVSLPMKA